MQETTPRIMCCLVVPTKSSDNQVWRRNIFTRRIIYWKPEDIRRFPLFSRSLRSAGSDVALEAMRTLALQCSNWTGQRIEELCSENGSTRGERAPAICAGK